MKIVIQSKKAPAPIGPYSQAILSNNTLYVSGQIALDPETGILLNKSIEEETHQVLKNIEAILQEANMNFSHVVKCSVFLIDFYEFAKMNAIYGQYFQDSPPARETVEVSRLPKNARIEISCIAIKE
jgi:2-iminobutanoate/2-iminopropanoate deaminase